MPQQNKSSASLIQKAIGRGSGVISQRSINTRSSRTLSDSISNSHSSRTLSNSIGNSTDDGIELGTPAPDTTYSKDDDSEDDGDSGGEDDGDDIDGNPMIDPEAELGKPSFRVSACLAHFCLQPRSGWAGGLRFILFSVPKSPSAMKVIVFTTFSCAGLAIASL
jgi:hypothetical protein